MQGALNAPVDGVIACLHEAPPAEASCGGQVLRRKQGDPALQKCIHIKHVCIR
jgi:hypothetical protein